MTSISCPYFATPPLATAMKQSWCIGWSTPTPSIIESVSHPWHFSVIHSIYFYLQLTDRRQGAYFISDILWLPNACANSLWIRWVASTIVHSEQATTNITAGHLNAHERGFKCLQLHLHAPYKPTQGGALAMRQLYSEHQCACPKRYQFYFHTTVARCVMITWALRQNQRINSQKQIL